MTPLDDELRRTLSDRASALEPGADPLAGVEARAARIRRRRVAVATAGAAAAVAAVALAVPAVMPDNRAAVVVPGATVAVTTAPTVAPSDTQVPAATTAPTTQAPPPAAPPNVVTWLPRGDATLGPPVENLLTSYAKMRGVETSDVAYRMAYASDSGPLRYTIGQAWARGDAKATTVSYEDGGTDGAVLRQYGQLGESPFGIVALITGHPGTSTDLLVVVTRPDAGPASYSPTATGSYQQIANGRSSLDSIGYVNRDPQATADRIQFLDGDAMHVLYDGPVSAVLCMGSPCS